MKGFRFIFVVMVVLVVSGCSLISQPETTQTIPAVTEPVTTGLPASPILTIEQLSDFSYTLPYDPNPIQLKNGTYEGASLLVKMADLNASGDLNGDGLEDWVILVSANTGGSGVFESLVAVLNQNGVPQQAGTAMLGDRVQVKSLSIQQGEIFLDLVVQGPNDPQCCPSQPQKSTYRLTDSGLFLVHVSTQTASGAQRDLVIDSPANGTLVSTSVDVQGSFTIGPFENTLLCAVIAQDGTQISQQPLMVQTAEMGAAGTFLAGIDFSGIPAGQKFFVVISDLSPADGSILTLDAVELIRQ